MLLDEFPAADLPEITTYFLTRNDTWWRYRVMRQQLLTQYRLLFRQTYYPASTGKNQLIPPDPSTYDITFEGPAAVGKVNGHAVVLRRYSLRTYIVGRTNTAGLGDPVLAAIGGSTSENFHLPVDPTLVVQRTGFACVDEADFPLNSVDPEGIENFYDDTCGIEAPYSGAGECEQCHCSATVRETCRSALQRYVGRTIATLPFTRIPWSESIAAAMESRNTYSLLSNVAGVDLIGQREAMKHNWQVYRYFAEASCERRECVSQAGWRRLVMFDALHINAGNSDYTIGALAYYEADPTSFNPLTLRNMYYWDTCHGHPHFTAYATFSAGSNLGHKQGFCVQSTGRSINHRNVSVTSAYGLCTFQGISTGWSDSYNGGIPCQWVDLTTVDTSGGPVARPLTMEVNPKNWMCEGNVLKDGAGDPLWVPTGELTTAPPYTEAGQSIDKMACTDTPGALANNIDSVEIVVPTPGNGLLTSPCLDPQQNFGPNRDCEFTLRSAFDACNAGSDVTLQCTVPSSAKAQVLRLCESSIALGTGTACRVIDSFTLANVVLLPGVSTPVKFKCPAARDAIEVGGRYSTYSGPVFNPHAAAPITCTVTSSSSPNVQEPASLSGSTGVILGVVAAVAAAIAVALVVIGTVFWRQRRQLLALQRVINMTPAAVVQNASNTEMVGSASGSAAPAQNDADASLHQTAALYDSLQIDTANASVDQAAAQC